MNTFYLLISKFSILLIFFLTNKVLSAGLEINEFGSYKIVLNILSLISFAAFPGINESISFIISRGYKGGKNLILKRTKIIIYSSLTFCITCFIINNLQLLNINYFIPSSLLIFSIFFLPLFLQNDLITSSYIAFKDYKNYCFHLILTAILFLIGIFISFNLGINKGLNIALISMIISSIPSIFFIRHIFKKLKNGDLNNKVKIFAKKQNLTKAPQLLFNSDLIIFTLASGNKVAGEIAALNVITFGLKSIYGIIQNRLTNYLYRFEVKEFFKILNFKYSRIYIFLYLAFSISFSIFIIPLIFRLVFEENYYYIIPYAVIYSVFYLISSPISLFNIPLKVHLGTKENFFINSFHPLLSFVLILLLSSLGLNGYLFTRIILMLTINIYYLKSIKKLIT